MARLITLRGRTARTDTGFSLIEVLVAVVILATGLLALAALQGTLARNSADAKARSAVMSALTSRMAQIREAPPTTDTTWTTATPWVSSAAAQAGASVLKVEEDIQTISWDATTSAFSAGAVVDSLSTFARATLTATWTAADGEKSLVLASDLSGLIYGDGEGYPFIDPLGSASKFPVVRQSNPELQAGVIPIAYGTGADARSTAASNPKPVLIGSTTVVGTQFDVLTYVPEGSSAIIKRRIDTNLVKCRCTTGLSEADRYSVSGVAQWPTVWDGDKYATYTPADKSAPPAEALKAGENPAFAGKKRSQSALCTECCKDRIDTADMPVKFGPEGKTDRFDLNSSNELVASSTGNFVAACRVIRNDGIYKTASDMYQRQFGLLATEADPATSAALTDLAKSGRPTGAATTNYGEFVKKYLEGYLTTVASSGSAPTTTTVAQTAFDDYLSGILNNPGNVPIPAISSSDLRYLHARGLYSDFLTTTAQTTIKNAITACAYADKVECLLPHLAFTTINMTELAKWSASDTKLNVIPAGTLLGTSVAEPFGGRTNGVKETPLSYTKVSSSLSNSTLAFRAGMTYVNTDEANPANWLTDQQKFSVGTSGGPFLPYITVAARGLLVESPITAVTVNLSTGTSCTPGTSDYQCDTASLPATLGLVVSNYNLRETVESSLPTVNVVCGPKTLTVGRNYQNTYSGISVSLTDGGASIGTTTYSPPASRSLLQTATWNATWLNDRDTLYLNFLGGEKQCPTTANTCLSGNKFGGWGTTYTAAACAIEIYRP